MQKTHKRYYAVLRRLRGRIALSFVALLLERMARAFWPLATLLLATYAFAAFGGFLFLPVIAARTILGIAVAAGAVLFYTGLRRLDIPDRAAAIERLDRNITGRPLSALRDTAVQGDNDPLTRALWAHHRIRMAKAAMTGAVPPPDLRLAARDRWGLRLMALVLALSAVVFSSGGFDGGLVRIIGPQDTAGAPGTSFEVWITPPEYTARPTVYLRGSDTPQRLQVPQGAKIVVRVYGMDVTGGKSAGVSETVSGNNTRLTRETEGLAGAEFMLNRSGEVAILRGRQTLARWRVDVLADTPPSVRITAAPAADAAGDMELPVTASDDYGVVSGQAVITLDLDRVDRRFGLAPDPVPVAPIVLDLPMPFSGSTAEVTAKLRASLARHPWAGLPVSISVSVVDGAGQRSDPAVMRTTLPGRAFANPLAAAIIEQRQALLWSPQNDRRILRVLRAVTYRPADLGLSAGAYLVVRSVVRQYADAVARGLDTTVRTRFAAMLWDAAARIEDGATAGARARLSRAQQRLSDALDRNAPDSELQKLAEDLRRATADFLRQLALDAQKNGGQQQAQQGDTQMLDGKAIQQMLDRLQQLMQDGRTAEARQLLEQLGRMLQNLQITRGDNGAGQNPQGTLDPLGRAIGGSGGAESGDSLVPGPDVGGRVQQLLDEIRRRTGEQSRPESERDYLKRLLDRF